MLQQQQEREQKQQHTSQTGARMLSKHWERNDRGQRVQARLAWLVQSSGEVVKDNLQAMSQRLPDSGSCIGLRQEAWPQRSQPQNSQRVRTTISQGRVFAPAACKTISTTVSTSRTKKVVATTSATTGHSNGNSAHAVCSDTTCGKIFMDVPLSADGLKVTCTTQRRLLQAVAAEAKAWAPELLQVLPMMMSPSDKLAGIVASTGVPCARAPAIQVPYPPELQEEEEFAALIFPGFDSGAFVWKITCCQIAEFAFSMLLGHDRANPTPCVLYSLGASWGPALARGELWRLITPVMLHANLSHLLFNVFFQLRMGFGMEKQFGRDKMMLMYFACGVFGNLMSVMVDPYKLAVGASTAGFGLIGVWLAEILLSWDVLGPARERTVIWIVFMLISVSTMSSMTPNMDIWGHFGGALGGFLLGIVLAEMPEQNRPSWYSDARAAAVLGLLTFAGGGLGRVLLFNPTNPMPNCSLLLPILQRLKA